MIRYLFPVPSYLFPVPSYLFPVTCSLLLLTNILHAQDVRNDMFGTRKAGYEPKVSKRGEMVTEVDPKLKPFYHGVASGDPTSNSVILWTRVTPESGQTSIPVSFRVATDPGLNDLVGMGGAVATSEHDFCVKVDVADLQPGTVYYYGFTVNGVHSLTGRTRTLPVGGIDHARLAVVSCSNYPAGFFNAYGHIADRNDLDAVLHLGDYIYEYDADTTSYGGKTGKQLGRMHEPDAELIQMTDYLTRYAQYRLDEDLRRLHQQHPVIHVWDDHESANDSYTDGAENHNPGEGPWSERKAYSKFAHSWWMPIRDDQYGRIYRSFSIGDLADIFMLDTRLDGRDKQVNDVGPDAEQASVDSLNAPDRTIMSSAQYDWLTSGLAGSQAYWRVLGNQVMFTPVTVTPVDTTFLFSKLSPIYSAIIRPQIPTLQDVFELAFLGDVWSNYPAQRSALVNTIKTEQVARTVVVTGDFHTSFAFDGQWPSGPNNFVEFMTPSISAANFDENLTSVPAIAPIAPFLIETIDTTLRQLNPHMKFNELNSHGYMILDLTKQRAQNDWYFVDTILAHIKGERWVRGYTTTGNGQLTLATAEAPGKTTQDTPAPPDPPTPTSVREEPAADAVLLGFGPNPVTTSFYISYTSASVADVSVDIVDEAGRVVYRSGTSTSFVGLNSHMVDVRSLSNGAYFASFHIGTTNITIPLVITR